MLVEYQTTSFGTLQPAETIFTSSSWKAIDAGAIIERITPFLRSSAYTIQAASVIFKNVSIEPSRGFNYLPDFAGPCNAFLTFSLNSRPVDLERLRVETLDRYVWRWRLGDARFLTFGLTDSDLRGNYRAIKPLMWFLNTLAVNYRNSRAAYGYNLDNFGTRSLGDFNQAYGKATINFLMRNVSPKWWVFNERVWADMPNLLMDSQMTDFTAAYYLAFVRQSVKSIQSTNAGVKDLLLNYNSKLNTLVRDSARRMTFDPLRFSLPPDYITQYSQEAALPLFYGIDNEEEFTALRNKIIRQGAI